MNIDVEVIKPLLPLVIIQLILIVVAIIDLLKHYQKKSELLWLPVIIFCSLLGPIVYFTVGRKRL